jgi:hypothetical protein
MTPEDYYRGQFKPRQAAMFDMRIKSLEWMLACFKKGTIRSRTIIGLIPITQLNDLLEYLVDLERYEECSIVKEIIDTIYNKTKTKTNL